MPKRAKKSAKYDVSEDRSAGGSTVPPGEQERDLNPHVPSPGSPLQEVDPSAKVTFSHMDPTLASDHGQPDRLQISNSGGGSLDLKDDQEEVSEDEVKSYHTHLTGSSSSMSSIGLGSSGPRKSKSAFQQFVEYFLSSGLAMCVPIILIVVLSALTLDRAVHDYNLITKTHDLVDKIPLCNVHHMNERDIMATVLEFRTSEALAVQAMQRADVDRCRRELHELIAVLAESNHDLFNQPLLEMADEQAEIALMRRSIDEGNITGLHERDAFTAIIQRFSDLTLRIDDQLKIPSPYLARLHTVQTLTSYVGWARGIGNDIVLKSSPPLVDLREEYVAAFSHADGARKESESIGVPGFASEWKKPEVQAMWDLMTQLRERGGYHQVYPSRLSWWNVTTGGVEELTRYFISLQEEFGVGESVAHIRDESIKLCVGVLLCVVAALLLGLHQSRLRTRMMKQIDALGKARKAVSAFVPRSFLATMGYTSITQVQPGNCTETAMTMLFADIRRFTTVAEGMGNTELFDWVQAYFARMTSVIESGRGQINMFIGDALFAVFKNSRDACMTGVKMHSSVEQLNTQNRCAPTTARKIPVEIGVGIHQDCVALGVLGDENRHTCTLISASVNLASRLEGLTKHLRCTIIVSESVIESQTEAELADSRYRCLGPAMVKGSGTASVLYELFMADEENLQNYKIETKKTFEDLVTAQVGNAITDSARQHLVKAATKAEDLREIRGTRSPSMSASITTFHNTSRNGMETMPILVDTPLPDGQPAMDDDVESSLGDPASTADNAIFGQSKDTFEEALRNLLQSHRGSHTIKRLLIELLRAQKEYQVTDETFYRLLMYYQGNAMVFGVK